MQLILALIMMNVVKENTNVVPTEPVPTHLGHIHVNVMLDFLVTVLNASIRMNVQRIAMLATHLPTASIQRFVLSVHITGSYNRLGFLFYS